MLNLDAIKARAEATDTGLREALTLARRGGYEPAARAIRDAILTMPALVAEVERLRGIERGWQHDRSEWAAERDAARAERDELAAKVDNIRALIAEHPDVCDLYTEGDIVGCGWKAAVIDLRAALDAEA